VSNRFRAPTKTSSYDILSVDDDGDSRYIEVNSTTGDDPSDPFPISAT
jgi:hypothetical protein